MSLDRLLLAPPGRAFDAAFTAHGPVTAEDVPVLAAHARAADAQVRHNAVLLLRLARSDIRFPALEALARETTDAHVFAIAAAALPDGRGRELATERPALLAAAHRDDDPRVRAAAATLGDTDEALADSAPRVRDEALAAMADHGPGGHVAELRAMLVDPAQRRGLSLQALYAALLHVDDPGLAADFARSLEGASVSDAATLANAISQAPARPAWLRGFLLGQLAHDAPFRWPAFALLAADPDPPHAELVATAAAYLADRVARGERGSDEGLNACAGLLGALHGSPLPDEPALLAFAQRWPASATN